VEITFDSAKRLRTLLERGLDFADAVEVFAGDYAVARDLKRDYGEPRFITAGVLRGRMVVVVWTPRDGTRRIISMRTCHEREASEWRKRVG
jgi:uncharacterized DUF497 family protein